MLGLAASPGAPEARRGGPHRYASCECYGLAARNYAPPARRDTLGASLGLGAQNKFLVH